MKTLKAEISDNYDLITLRKRYGKCETCLRFISAKSPLLNGIKHPNSLYHTKFVFGTDLKGKEHILGMVNDEIKSARYEKW